MKWKKGSFENGKELWTTAQRLFGIQRIVRFCRSSSKVAVLKKIQYNPGNFPKNMFSKNWNANWIKQKFSILSENSTTIHFTFSKKTPIQSYFRKNEELIHNNICDNRKKQKPNFYIEKFFRIANGMNIFLQRRYKNLDVRNKIKNSNDSWYNSKLTHKLFTWKTQRKFVKKNGINFL